MGMTDSFFNLTPEHIFNAVEEVGCRSTGRCFALNSLENRVYEIELEDERRVIGKFYRPGRWSREAILEEHEFLKDLAAQEIPVAEPLKLQDGTTLGKTQSTILFAVFPKLRGRAPPRTKPRSTSSTGPICGPYSQRRSFKKSSKPTGDESGKLRKNRS